MAVWLAPAVRDAFPGNARHFLEYMERARRDGVKVGADFGTYDDRSSLRIKGFSAGYGSPYVYAMWDRYKECSDSRSCSGMSSKIAEAVPKPPFMLD
jgi:hypothetical protein